MKYQIPLALIAGLIIGSMTTMLVGVSKLDFENVRATGTVMSPTGIDGYFIEEMIPHHEGAIMMAQHALSEAKTKEVQQLAQNIITSQQAEIDQMKAWYKEWFGNDVPVDMHGAHGEGMQSMSGDMDALAAADDFDKEFIRQMIPHHEMAVMMAEMLQVSSARMEMVNFAQRIIDAQKGEITDMNNWLAQWT